MDDHVKLKYTVYYVNNDIGNVALEVDFTTNIL